MPRILFKALYFTAKILSLKMVLFVENTFCSSNLEFKITRMNQKDVSEDTEGNIYACP